MDGNSYNIIEDKLKRLKKVIPEVFAEGNIIDLEKLKLTLGENVNISDERYVLNWAGKSDAFKVLQTPTTATLAPAKEESINFETTDNIFIEGENLEVLKILQKSYYGAIKMIYIDPPYNTGNDNFIYPDKFSETKEEYLKRIGEKDEGGYLLKEGLFRKNSKENGQYHSNWLNMMYPRLFLAKNLLTDDGVIFVSIDDNEVYNLRLIMNEIFGEENFICTFVRRQNLAGKQDAKKISIEQDYILLYAKEYDKGNINKEIADLNKYKLSDEYESERGKFYLRRMDDDGMNYSDNLNYPIKFKKGEKASIYNEDKRICEHIILKDDLIIFPNNDKDNQSYNWRWSREKVEWGKKNDFIVLKKNRNDKWQINFKSYALVDNNLDVIVRKNPFGSLISNYPNNIAYNGFKELFNNKKFFDYPKPVGLIKHLLRIGLEKNDIVLDFFAGSGTTGQAIYELNEEDGEERKFILVQLPEFLEETSEAYKAGYKSIADICKERIRRVIKKINEEKKTKPQFFNDKNIDLGFKVFKLKNSNFKLWRGDVIDNEDDLSKQLNVFENPLRTESKEENILYELILKSGFSLTTKIEKSNGLYIIDNNKLIIVLSKIDDNIIKYILDIKPEGCIILDNLFNKNDKLKTNTALQMKDAGIEFKTI